MGTYNVDVYLEAPSDGLMSKARGSVLTIHALQTIHFPAVIFKAVVLNDDDEHDSSLADKPIVSFLARHERTALLKYALHHAMVEDEIPFIMVQEEVYFTKTSHGRPWISHPCVGTTKKRALWISGTEKTENAFLMGCPLDHNWGNDPNDTDHSILEGSRTDDRYYWDIWGSHSYRVAKVTPDGRVLWQLLGGEECCWDMCRQLAFDDAIGIVVVGTAQGHIWVLDYA